jgi:hypothetical protein
MIKSKKVFLILLSLLIIISLATKYYGSIDSIEYMGVAKFFTSYSNADLRSSHSLTYGLIHAPWVYLFKTYFIMKITSILWLMLIILSVYYMTNKDKKTLLLLIISPIIWYIGPWIGPIQLSALLFLWGFFFIDNYNKTGKLPSLFYSGILIGLAWTFWNTVIFLLFFIILCFFYKRNVNHLLLFLLSILLGLLPLLIIDKILYNFSFYSIIKHFIANIVVALYGSIYQGMHYLKNQIYSYISFLIMLPLFFYKLFYKNFFQERKRQLIFIAISFLFFLANPQIRYIMFLWPILMLYLPKVLNKKQFKIQLILFGVISLLVVSPYIIQIKYSTNSRDFTEMLSNFGNWQVSSINKDKLILQDINEITQGYPDEIFVIGNEVDSYNALATLYWDKNVREFVSIQDYNLWMQNKTLLFEKKFMPVPKIQDRRQIWISGGISKNENDATNYSAIKYAIGIGEPINLKDFKLVKNYTTLYLSEKINK